MSIFEQTTISGVTGDREGLGSFANGGINLEKLKRMEKYFPEEYQ